MPDENQFADLRRKLEQLNRLEAGAKRKTGNGKTSK